MTATPSVPGAKTLDGLLVLTLALAGRLVVSLLHVLFDVLCETTKFARNADYARIGLLVAGAVFTAGVIAALIVMVREETPASLLVQLAIGATVVHLGLDGARHFLHFHSWAISTFMAIASTTLLFEVLLSLRKAAGGAPGFSSATRVVFWAALIPMVLLRVTASAQEVLVARVFAVALAVLMLVVARSCALTLERQR